jgi:hypothetical protein
MLILFFSFSLKSIAKKQQKSNSWEEIMLQQKDCNIISSRLFDFCRFFAILLRLKLKKSISMTEKILQQLKAAVVGSGKTSITDQTFDAYASHLAAQISGEAQIADAVKPYIELLKVVQGNINHTAATSVTEKETALKTEYEKQIAELKEKQTDPNPDGVDARLKTLREEIATLKQEGETYRAREATEKRNASILAKAKELGIPQYRIDEGFSIAADADGAAIGNYLATVAKNAVAGQVETGKTGLFAPGTPLDQMKSEADAWAKSLPDVK